MRAISAGKGREGRETREGKYMAAWRAFWLLTEPQLMAAACGERC